MAITMDSGHHDMVCRASIMCILPPSRQSEVTPILHNHVILVSLSMQNTFFFEISFESIGSMPLFSTIIISCASSCLNALCYSLDLLLPPTLSASGQSSQQHNTQVHDVQLDYYGRRLATCSSDTTIKVFDVAGEQLTPVAGGLQPSAQKQTPFSHLATLFSCSWKPPACPDTRRGNACDALLSAHVLCMQLSLGSLCSLPLLPHEQKEAMLCLLFCLPVLILTQ